MRAERVTAWVNPSKIMIRPNRANQSSETVQSIKRRIRKIEIASNTGATGQTIAKRRPTPIELLADQGNIGAAELEACVEIQKAFNTLASSLLLRPINWERTDKGHGGDLPQAIVEMIRRYQAWANFWSVRQMRGDKLLPMVINSIIDNWSFDESDQYYVVRHGTTKKALICGLRHYASWAGKCDSRVSRVWRETAESLFRIQHPDLALASAAARVAALEAHKS